MIFVSKQFLIGGIAFLCAGTMPVTGSTMEIIATEAKLKLLMIEQKAIDDKKECEERWVEEYVKIDTEAFAFNVTQLSLWLEHDAHWKENRDEQGASDEEDQEKLEDDCRTDLSPNICLEKWKKLNENIDDKWQEIFRKAKKEKDEIEVKETKEWKSFIERYGDNNEKYSDCLEKVSDEMYENVKKTNEWRLKQEKKIVEQKEDESSKGMTKVENIMNQITGEYSDDLCCTFEGVQREMTSPEEGQYTNQFEKALEWAVKRCGYRFEIEDVDLVGQTFYTTSRRAQSIRATVGHRRDKAGTLETTNRVTHGGCYGCQPVLFPSFESLNYRRLTTAERDRKLSITDYICDKQEFLERLEFKLAVILREVFPGELLGISCRECPTE